MNLSKGISVTFGNHSGIIYGGPFKRFDHGERRLVGIKMAKEIVHPYDFSVPTEDFSVPDQKVLERGLIYAFESIASGKDVYVGCMGGIGRTGLFMAAATKCLWDWYEVNGTPINRERDPIEEVRAIYHHNAVETSEQYRYIINFDTSRVVSRMLELSGKTTDGVDYKKDRCTLWGLIWSWFGR